jgi:hypothetical protein
VRTSERDRLAEIHFNGPQFAHALFHALAEKRRSGAGRLALVSLPKSVRLSSAQHANQFAVSCSKLEIVAIALDRTDWGIGGCACGFVSNCDKAWTAVFY